MAERESLAVGLLGECLRSGSRDHVDPLAETAGELVNPLNLLDSTHGQMDEIHSGWSMKGFRFCW